MFLEQILSGPQLMSPMHPEGKKFLVNCVLLKVKIILISLTIVNYIFKEKYPQIKKLFGSDPNFKWIVSFMILIQLVMIFVVPKLPWPLVIGLAYCFGKFSLLAVSII